MRTALIGVLLAFAFGVAGVPLYYAHSLTLVPAICSMLSLGFGCYLIDSADFRAYATELKDAWLAKGGK